MADPHNYRGSLPIEIFLSVATIPLLAGLVASRAIAELVKTLGQTSEELFRGDRLPVLRFTPSPQEED
ncbi:MAG TPA: hypothetical protein IGS37_07565 [Synechococcales cyanobacterium M55_K2018_004]|nr:hypothetical protein [Synechococcales cyanobacterium M55_K2018_004]